MPEWFLKGGPVMYILLGCSVVSALDLIRKTGVRNVVFTVRPES